jgi:hypothetical protein
MQYINLKIVFFFLLISCCHKGVCQKTDSVFVVTLKSDETQAGFSTYSITIKNTSQTPVCILHSPFINLVFDPPQGLHILNTSGSIEIYSLEYTMRDTIYDYEGPINNFNGEIILPLQEIKFQITIKNSDRTKKLKFEYFPVKAFCYPEFKNEIFKNAAQWHKKYNRIEKFIELPK